MEYESASCLDQFLRLCIIVGSAPDERTLSAQIQSSRRKEGSEERGGGGGVMDYIAVCDKDVEDECFSVLFGIETIVIVVNDVDYEL